MRCGVEISWDFENFDIPAGGVIDEALREVFDLPLRRIVIIVAIEKLHKLLIIR